ncbi:MAG: tripartite tricarboxylate transporter TctB family protein [Peptococcaceae bacterium]
MKNRKITSDFIVGCVAMVLGFFIWFRAQSFDDGVKDSFRTDAFGPTLYPSFLGLMMVLAGIIIIVASLKINAKKQSAETEAVSTKDQNPLEEPVVLRVPNKTLRILVLYLFIVLYWLGAALIGYLIPTITFCLLVAFWLDGNWKRVMQAGGMAVVLYVLFFYLLQVPINRGLFIN